MKIVSLLVTALLTTTLVAGDGYAEARGALYGIGGLLLLNSIANNNQQQDRNYNDNYRNSYDNYQPSNRIIIQNNYPNYRPVHRHRPYHKEVTNIYYINQEPLYNEHQEHYNNRDDNYEDSYDRRNRY